MNTYNSSQVSVTIGATVIDGFETVTVARDEDRWSFAADSSGTVARSKNSSKIGTVTLVLKQTSAANALLSVQAELDAVIAVSVIDSSGSSIHTMPEGSIVKIPDAEYGMTEEGTREWVLRGNLPVHLVAGN